MMPDDNAAKTPSKRARDLSASSSAATSRALASSSIAARRFNSPATTAFSFRAAACVANMTSPRSLRALSG
jgi:hypothetical protein